MVDRTKNGEKLIDKLVGQHKKLGDIIRANKERILTGTFLSIDPASRDMGYAIFEKGKLIKNGSVSATGHIGIRLKKLFEQLPDIKPDFMAVEKVRSGTGHIYLVYSVAVPIIKYGCEMVEIPTRAWHKNIDSTYIKGDARDALEIGLFCIRLCEESE